MSTRIIERDPGSGYAGLASAFPPLQARLYANRGVTTPRELDYTLAALPAPPGLPGLETAVERLVQALGQGEAITVVGDFDADGATGTALVVLALRRMGAARVDYLVPTRFGSGYGLSPEIAEAAATEGARVLITVDNGVTSHAGVAAARACGLAVIVTDHHLPAEVLPAADAIVNPRLPGNTFPTDALAGVGVAFYLMAAVRARARATHTLRLDDLLDLVALGTVADVVPMDGVNRTLVHQGVGRMRRGRGRPGICSLLALGKRDPRHLVAADLGFAVAPRLNAAGRLEDMALGIECLLADDTNTAQALAERLDGLNGERRRIEQGMREQAEAALASLQMQGELPNALCLYDAAWHQGVVGILASRVRDSTARPVVACAPAEDGLVRGSMRSVAGFHARDALAAVEARHPGLLQRFGGHAVAAGLTLAASDLAVFRSAVEAEAERQLGPADLAASLVTDGELAFSELSLGSARLCESGGPWGQGFPEPSFHGLFQVRETRVVGERHLRLRLLPEGGAGVLDAIAFGAVEQGWTSLPDSVRVVYRLEVNRYRQRERLQLVVQHIEAVS